MPRPLVCPDDSRIAVKRHSPSARLANFLEKAVVPTGISGKFLARFVHPYAILSLRCGQVIIQQWTSEGEATYYSPTSGWNAVELSWLFPWISQYRITLALLLMPSMGESWSISVKSILAARRVHPVNGYDFLRHFRRGLQASNAPESWKAFTAAVKGDIGGMQKLFSEQRTSPKDETTDGWSLLNV